MSEEEQKVSTSDPHWERDLVNRLAFASLNEQRRTRRWGIFFKTLTFVYLFLLFFMLFSDRLASTGEHLGKHTALIDLQGEITDNSDTSSDNVIMSLRAAFEDEKTAGVVLRVNSPGGSPVQSGIIYDEIKRLRAEHKNVPIYAVVGDICASGCYYIVSATDAIYTNRASLVGSIGVLMDGFGFTGTMQKLGVERRLHTAGENKGFMDPFSPEQPAQVAQLNTMLGDIHQQFIQAVKDGRGKRLKEDPKLFTGLIWTGDQALALGLADGLGSLDSVARDVIGVEDIVDFTQERPYLERVFNRFGATMAKSFSEEMRMHVR
jgi:protease-4